MIELIKTIIEAMKEERALAKARKELLKDKLRESYFQMILDEFANSKGIYMEIEASFDNGKDRFVLRPLDKQAIKREGFWDKYNKAQAALGNK